MAAEKTKGARPKKNADGQGKKPSQNPDGKPDQGPPQGQQQGPPSTLPGGGGTLKQLKVNFTDLDPASQGAALQQMGIDPGAQQAEQAAGIQQQIAMGPTDPNGLPNQLQGVPEELASFPHDLAALMQVMNTGFTPGADNMQHQQALNASAMTRAHMKMTGDAAQKQLQDVQGVQALGSVFQRLMQNNAVPPPSQLAGAVSGGPMPNTSPGY